MKSRQIKTFEPKPDVLKMLKEASKDGIKLTHILNVACREWLTIRGYNGGKRKIETK